MKWALLALAAAAVIASFFVDCDEATPPPGNGHRAPRAAAVATARVVVEPVIERATYPGELDADAADVAAVFAGRLDALHVRVGDVLAPGDPVAVIAIVDLAEQKAEAEAQLRAARADVERVKAELEVAQREAGRIATLKEASLVAAQESDAAKARARALSAQRQRVLATASEAEARLALLERRATESTVRAPFAARVVDRYLDPGGFVQAGTRLVRLVATAPLRARFEVPEQHVGRVTVGAPADVTVPALDTDVVVPARVTGKSGEVLRDRRVVVVEALIEHPPEAWISGMYATATVVHRTIDDAPVVPAAALLTRMGDGGALLAGVFVADAGVARWVPTEVVARANDRVALRGAIAAGAEVLVAGHQDLADGAPIRTAAPGTPADKSAPEVRP